MIITNHKYFYFLLKKLHHLELPIINIILLLKYKIFEIFINNVVKNFNNTKIKI